MRQALVGAAAPMWVSTPTDAAVLLVSIPSGDLDSVRLRTVLINLRPGPPPAPSSRKAPIVSHSTLDESALPSNYIYIGASTSTRLSTPWLDPTEHVTGYGTFDEYLYWRRDLLQFLAPLLGSTLVCSCSRGEGCHGYRLREACIMVLEASVEENPIVDAKVIANMYVSVDKMLVAENFVPSGRTSTTTVGTRVSASLQPGRAVLPQLIEDGLSPEAHLRKALRLPHPFQREVTLFEPVAHALKYAPESADVCLELRLDTIAAVRKLCSHAMIENMIALELIHADVKAILCSGGHIKNVVAMRELHYSYSLPDWGAAPYLLTGLPLVGPSDFVPGMLERFVPPEYSVQEFSDTWKAQNEKVYPRLGPSDDKELDRQAYSKTLQELERGVIRGPFRSIEALPMPDPCIIPRCGTWEQHGGAEEPTVRVIDDMLMGGHNATASYSSSHRPTDGDSMCAQQRASQQRFPRAPMSGWTSDFAKAFKQVPRRPSWRRLAVFGLWCPGEEMTHFFIALSQLFGGRLAPQNFSRYPAWLCFLLAYAFVVPIQHCVDDMCSIERSSTIMCGWRAWRETAALLGWDVPDSKSPEPSQEYIVVGYNLNLRGTPDCEAKLQVADGRIEALLKYIGEILEAGALPGGAAGSLFGRLGFTLNAVQGRYGRALMKPIKRRQYEHRSNLNHQLRASLEWWLKFLRTYTPRSIPVNLSSLKVVISYSDGEGTGGVGVALWYSDTRRPKAAFMVVPWLLRRLWALQTSKVFRGAEQRDIFEIEAIGPLLILDLWPELLKNCLWVHYIDNSAAQAALTRGSSSVESGDAIVSATWKRIVEIRCLPWFDRVESDSNPVDGLSRGRMMGPWREVQKAKIPPGLLMNIKAELRTRGVSI